MNATFDRLFNQSNEEYEKLTDKGVEITFGVSLSKAAIKALTQDIVGITQSNRAGHGWV
jgi:hypothetical protein